MKHKLVAVYQSPASFEMSIDMGGSNYLVIYGSSMNGGWCCLPKHGIACEMSQPEDTFYNREALLRAGLTLSVAREIASAIRNAEIQLRFQTGDR